MKKIYLSFLSLLTFGIVNAQSPQITNSGFESWTSSKKATGWSSTNDYIPLPGFQNVFKDSLNIKSGNYSIKAETKSLAPYSTSNAPGVFTNGTYSGTIDNFNIDAITPVKWIYSEKPDSITGYYKYTKTGSDSATFYIRFFNGGQIIGEGFFQEGNNRSTYTRLSAPINWVNTLMPDSMLILISSSVMTASNQSVGSVLYLDNLGFAGLTGVKSISSNSVKLYPNPAKNLITLKGLNNVKNEVCVYNTLGSLVLKTSANNGVIDVEKLQTGVYVIEVSTDKEKITQRFVKE